MTAILFIVALVLAWPTAGLSIVAYIAYLVFRGYVQARSRMHGANQLRSARDISEGKGRLPSWMGNRDKISEFIFGVEQLALRAGVPIVLSSQIMLHDDVQRNLMHYAGAMEARGATFAEQQMAVAEKVVDIYNRAG